MLNDFEIEEKLKKVNEAFNASYNKRVALENKKFEQENSLNFAMSKLRDSLLKDFGYDTKNVEEIDNLIGHYDKNGNWIKGDIANDNGTLNYAAENMLDNMIKGFQTSITTTVPEKEASEDGEAKSNFYTVNTDTDPLNLRQAPKTGEIIDAYEKGTEVEVLKTEDGWSQVKVGDKEGWMSSNYLKPKETTDDTTETSQEGETSDNTSNTGSKKLNDEQNQKVYNANVLLEETRLMNEQVNATDSELLGVQQEQHQALLTIIETQKEAVNKAYEERRSLYDAVIDNTTHLKKIVDMQGQLIKDTQYKDKAKNIVNSYDRTIDNISAYEKNNARINKDLDGQRDYIEDLSGKFNIDVSKWFSASGEMVEGMMNADYQKLFKQYEKLLNTGQQNTEEAQELQYLLGAIDNYGQLIVEKNENQQNLQNEIVAAIEAQSEIIKQGQEYLKQYTEELVSQYNANSDTNDLISGYLGSMKDALDVFNIDQIMTLINAQIATNKNERTGLIEQQSIYSDENNRLIREMKKVTTEVDVESLFTDKGEIMTYNYNEALVVMDELVATGEITDAQMADWKINLEQVGENKKQEVELENQIIDSYEQENSLIEEKNDLIAKSYDWQISKMGSLLELTNKRFETENKIFELRVDLDKELRSAKQSMQWLTKSERIKIFNEEDYAQLYSALDEMEAKTQSYYDDYYGQMMNLTEETLYQQEFITAEYERRMALVEAEYALTQKRVNLEKEQLKLKNVAAEKDSRVYINGEWKQVANTEELISASDAVADAEKEYELAQQEKLQKMQENQMNDYIDSLKEIQAALENSTKHTNSTEEELLNRLSKTIGDLIGSDTTDGALKNILDNLAIDLHNYEQITGKLINEDLKTAINALSTFTTNLTTQIDSQNTVLKKEIGVTSSTLSSFNREVSRVKTDTLCKRLGELNEEVGKFIETLKNKVSNNTDVQRIANDIAHEKEQWEYSNIINEIAWLKKEDDAGAATQAYAESQARLIYDKYKTEEYSEYSELFTKLENLTPDQIDLDKYKELYGEDSEVFKDINNIVWYKNQWNSGLAQSEWAQKELSEQNYYGQLPQEIRDAIEPLTGEKTEEYKNSFRAPHEENTRKYYKELEDKGFGWIANMMKQMDAQTAKNFEEALRTTDSIGWFDVANQDEYKQYSKKIEDGTIADHLYRETTSKLSGIAELVNDYAFTFTQWEEAEAKLQDADKVLKDDNATEKEKTEAQEAKSKAEEAKKEAGKAGAEFRKQIEELDLGTLGENLIQWVDSAERINRDALASQLMEQKDNNVHMSMILDTWKIKSDSKLATETDNALKEAESTEEFGVQVGEFETGVEGYTFSVDKEAGVITIFDATGKEFKGSVEDFETFVSNLEGVNEDFVSNLDTVLSKIASQVGVETRRTSSGKWESENTKATLPDGTEVDVYVDENGKTQTQLPVGSIVHTSDGDFKIKGGSAGNYQSKPVNSGGTSGKSGSSKTQSGSGSSKSATTNNKSEMPQWMKNLGYASGTLSSDAGIYNVDEIGKELIIPSGRLRMMEYGDQVVPHNLSENILKWGALNPAILRSLSPERTNNITNNKEVKVNIENINLDNVTNGENFMPELNRYLQRTNTLL